MESEGDPEKVLEEKRKNLARHKRMRDKYVVEAFRISEEALSEHEELKPNELADELAERERWAATNEAIYPVLSQLKSGWPLWAPALRSLDEEEEAAPEPEEPPCPLVLKRLQVAMAGATSGKRGHFGPDHPAGVVAALMELTPVLEAGELPEHCPKAGSVSIDDLITLKDPDEVQAEIDIYRALARLFDEAESAELGLPRTRKSLRVEAAAIDPSINRPPIGISLSGFGAPP